MTGQNAPRVGIPAIAPLAYRPKDAAVALGISRTQLYRMIATGEIEARKLGGATIIRHDEITRVIQGAAPMPVTKPAQASIK